MYTFTTTTSNLVVQGIIVCLQLVMLTFLHNYEFFHGFLADLMITDNLWFLVPLSWMMMAYITVFMTRRNALLTQVFPVSTVLESLKGIRSRTIKHKH